MGHKSDRPDVDLAAIIAERHLGNRAIHPGIVTLGAWLMLGPAALGEHGPVLVLSDFVAGLLLVALGCSFAPRRGWVPWSTALVGVWLLLAPVTLWAPSPAAYASDTLIGALVIALSVVMPRSIPTPGPESPSGWSYNPSTWTQRAPITVLALVGFASAGYMAAYQLGYIATMWDPVFGDGTRRLLDGSGSRSSPVALAGVAASVYLLEALMAVTGNACRWRTMPWMVTLFGLVVFFVGVASTGLAMLPVFTTSTWCTPCLVVGAAALAMVPLAFDEMVATIQFLFTSRRAGAPLWETFWHGADGVV